MVITTNMSLSVRNKIREALKNFNTNPFSTAGLHEDALNAEDEILMQISDQTKRVTLQDIGGYLDMSGDTSYTKAEIDTKDANTSNVISTRINNLPIIDLQPYQLISDSYTKAENNLQIANTSNYVSSTSNLLATDYNLKIDQTNFDTANSLVTAMTNLDIAPTVNSIFPLFYNNHFQQISDGLNPNQISVKNINSAGRFGYDFLKVPPQELFDTIENIEEPT